MPARLSLALLAACAILVPSARPSRIRAQAGETLVFVVHGLRADTGLVRGGTYSSREVWTDVGGQVATCTARPRSGIARCTLTAPGPGRYAFAFYHDADDDSQLDRDLLGAF